MGEIDRSGRLNSQLAPDDCETSSEEEEQKTRRDLALQQLFLILESAAEKTGKPVNTTTHTIPMEIKTQNETGFYVLRINPAIISNGKLNVVVLDLYGNNGNHFQQWVVKAEWTDGMPQITDLDELTIANNQTRIRLTEIAEHVGKLMREETENEIDDNIKANFIMSMPTDYSPRIN